MSQKRKFLVLGSGGREHAICWHLKKYGDEVEAAPGSDAIGEIIPTWSFKDFKELFDLSQEKLITDIIVGPENYLAEGIADYFKESPIRVFGPTKKAAQLETDKAFSKDFCTRHQIPTARSVTIESAADLKTAIKEFKKPFVVKATGLAGGKGVWIGDNEDEAITFGSKALDSHDAILLEDFLPGEEVSYFCLVDKDEQIVLGHAQDHKRLLEDDQGPNTGGMGSYGPLQWMTPALEKKIQREIVEPTLRGLLDDGLHYRGFIFFGLMVSEGQPYLLEYNCRMGDPETQSLLMRLETPLSELLEALETGTAAEKAVQRKAGVSMNVVLAAKGYPDDPQKGFAIPGLETAPPSAEVFHAGTKKQQESYRAAGGRLVSIATLQEDVTACRNHLYPWIESLSFLDKITYRRDIAASALSKEERERHAKRSAS